MLVAATSLRGRRASCSPVLETTAGKPGVETNDALTTGWALYGEPNPEVLGNSWPYWSWGNYVQWWHSTY